MICELFHPHRTIWPLVIPGTADLSKLCFLSCFSKTPLVSLGVGSYSQPAGLAVRSGSAVGKLLRPDKVEVVVADRRTFLKSKQLEAI